MNQDLVVLQEILDSVLFQKTNQGMVITTLEGRILAVNHQYEKLSGYKEDELIGQMHNILQADSDDPIWKELWEKGNWNGEHVSFKKDQTRYHEGLNIRTIYKKRDEPIFFLLMCSDVTEVRRKEQLLELAVKVFENMLEGIIIIDKEHKVHHVNPAFTKITGYDQSDVLGKGLNFMYTEKNGIDFFKKVQSILKEKGEWKGEVWSRRKDGGLYANRVSATGVLNEEGEIAYYVAAFSDCTTQKNKEDYLYKLAHVDVVTQLPNRRSFEERLEMAIHTAREYNKKVALIFIDLDCFKKVNDEYGHTVGDKLLRMVGERLEKLLGDHATVGRWGGDEFTLILENCHDLSEVTATAKSIHDALAKPFLLDEGLQHIKPNIGISVYPEDGLQADELIEKADKAMYIAKKEEHRFRYYSKSVVDVHSSVNQLSDRIKQGMADNEFFLLYQPQLSLATGKLVGMEALLRWNKKGEGLVSPAEFIPLAEETGQIVELGAWVIQMVCEQIQCWAEETRLTYPVSINISALQLEDPHFVEKVKHIISSTGIEAAYLRFELTESVFIKDQERMIQRLNECKELGIQFALDDFGTGYSSLSYLKRLPVNELKIDQSFLKDMLLDGSNATIVSAVIDIAHSLGIRVVAEGIELEDQELFLKKQNCDVGQGYLYSRPIPGEEIKNKWLRSSSRKTRVTSVTVK
ncbi:EAL domain-containing protein [Bacillaceae bacterium SIJ1]|nr:EAL domain-containing protein [Litoribacterium kuwaitense]